MADINYKMKYENLKNKFMNSVDMAFRLGYEQGAKDAEVQAAAEAQAAQAQAEAQMGGAPGEEGQDAAPGQGGQEGQEEAPVMPDGSPMQESEHPMGSELDQHIAQLESMLTKAEPSAEELKKALNEVRSFKEKVQVQRNNKAVKRIAKALAPKKPFVVGAKAQSNLSPVQKSALSLQENIVNRIMKSWEEEESKAGKSILDTLKIESLTKKE